jgi:hypothetical protein
VKELSPELRDLLDQIFVADELKRITIQVRPMHYIVSGVLQQLIILLCDSWTIVYVLAAGKFKRMANSSARNLHNRGSVASALTVAVCPADTQDSSSVCCCTALMRVPGT